MNDQKKLKLSKETLRCLDDDALTDVVGGGGGKGGHGGNFSGNCLTTPRAASTFRSPASAIRASATLRGGVLIGCIAL